MKRREFITLLGGAAATWPLTARAQQADRMRRIGVLMAVSERDADVRVGVAIFQQSLQELGWKNAHNVRIDYRWGDADPERIQALAKELVDLQPDVLIGHSTPSAKGLLRQTRSIPIVFLTVTDPLGQGLVASLSQPGGNITGFSVFEFSLGSKWLEALKQIAPGIRRVTAIFNPETAPYYGLYLQSINAMCLPWQSNQLQPRFIAKPTSRTSFARSGANRTMAFSFCRTATMWSIVSGSSSSPQNIVCRRSTISGISHPTVGSFPMARMKWISSDALRVMWIELSKVRIRQIFRSSSRQNLSW